MKFWKIVKGMCESQYEEGQIFSNSDCGDMIIENGTLRWIGYDGENTDVCTVLNDDTEWDLL